MSWKQAAEVLKRAGYALPKSEYRRLVNNMSQQATTPPGVTPTSNSVSQEQSGLSRDTSTESKQ